ncbi:MAG: FKBP-type peptidyl-prolyl cis-trans isomerase [Actinobacteria bacterium]|nr:FKBP-type peptidyl-prolyl cis-trans isomerase [Actinomycetota bacterium]
MHRTPTTAPRAHRRPRRARATALGLVIALAAATAAGCGSDSGGGSDDAAGSSEGECRTVEVALEEKTAPDPTVPAKGIEGIEKTDDIVGCGDEVQADSSVQVHYVLKSQSSGQVVDSSWERGQPFDVTLGVGQVIKGWDEGIPGMRAGGRRTLVLGPDYGYGAAGSPPDIAPGDTLVFVVDVLSVN